MSIFVGLWGASMLWPSAIRTSAATIPVPTTAPLCLRTRGTPRAQGARTPRAVRGTAASAIPDPWVDRGVDHVYRQVDQDVAHGDEEHHALHEREVLVQDGVHQQPADPGPPEDGLDDHRAGQQAP